MLIKNDKRWVGVSEFDAVYRVLWKLRTMGTDLKQLWEKAKKNAFNKITSKVVTRKKQEHIMIYLDMELLLISNLASTFISRFILEIFISTFGLQV